VVNVELMECYNAVQAVIADQWVKQANSGILSRLQRLAFQLQLM
jgi:hypothetical protein